MSRSMQYGLKVSHDDRRLHPHRVIAENALGHRLPKGAQIHHVNGDKTDNRNRNLVICQSNAYHALLHQRARTIQAGGDPDTERVCCSCHKPRPFVEFDQLVVHGCQRARSECKTCSAERYQRRKPEPKPLNPRYKVVASKGRVHELLARGLSQRLVAAEIGVRQGSIALMLMRERRKKEQSAYGS